MRDGDVLGGHFVVHRVSQVGGRDVVRGDRVIAIAAHGLRRLAVQVLEMRSLDRFGLRFGERIAFGLRRRGGILGRGRGFAFGRRLLGLGFRRGRIGSGRPWRVGPFHTVLASPRCYIRSADRPLPKEAWAGWPDATR